MIPSAQPIERVVLFQACAYLFVFMASLHPIVHVHGSCMCLHASVLRVVPCNCVPTLVTCYVARVTWLASL
jgi:hypothetical protein